MRPAIMLLFILMFSLSALLPSFHASSHAHPSHEQDVSVSARTADHVTSADADGAADCHDHHCELGCIHHVVDLEPQFVMRSASRFVSRSHWIVARYFGPTLPKHKRPPLAA